MMKEMFFKSQLAQLVKKAEQNADVGLYCDFILDNVPEPALLAFLGNGDPYERLVAMNPDVAKHEQWFRSLGIMLNEALAPEETPGDNDGLTDNGQGVVSDADKTGTSTTTADNGGDASRDT